MLEASNHKFHSPCAAFNYRIGGPYESCVWIFGLSNSGYAGQSDWWQTKNYQTITSQSGTATDGNTRPMITESYLSYCLDPEPD